MRARWPKSAPFQLLSASPWADQRPTYREAEPKLIAAALRRSQARPSGNWYAFAASDRIGTARPLGVTVGGYELVAWRGQRRGAARRARGVPASGRRPVDRRARRGCVDLPVAWIAADRMRRIRLAAVSVPTTTACWPGCVWTRVGGETPTEMPVVARRPGSATDTRGHQAGRHVRAARHHRQPARPVARRLVSPVFVHPARSAGLARRRATTSPRSPTVSWSR